MAATTQTQFQEQLERIYAFTACKTQADLAKLLEISQSAIAEAKKRRTIPFSWLGKLTSMFGVHPNWIMHGLEPQFIGQSEVILEMIKLFPKEVLITELQRREVEL